ncbi:MAG TPA: DUF1328 domain-containing protein [Caulobacteraceae bacterium]|nr:DUF1328 domain-containing protein [Caulobacteraceae bacterium]
MLGWAFLFLVIALAAGVLGFSAIVGAAIGLAKLFFYIFIVLFVISLIMHLVRGRGRAP